MASLKISCFGARIETAAQAALWHGLIALDASDVSCGWDDMRWHQIKSVTLSAHQQVLQNKHNQNIHQMLTVSFPLKKVYRQYLMIIDAKMIQIPSPARLQRCDRQWEALRSKVLYQGNVMDFGIVLHIFRTSRWGQRNPFLIIAEEFGGSNSYNI